MISIDEKTFNYIIAMLEHAIKINDNYHQTYLDLRSNSDEKATTSQRFRSISGNYAGLINDLKLRYIAYMKAKDTLYSA